MTELLYTLLPSAITTYHRVWIQPIRNQISRFVASWRRFNEHYGSSLTHKHEIALCLMSLKQVMNILEQLLLFMHLNLHTGGIWLSLLKDQVT